ncbi:nucleotide-diphospho-sugar transferase [Hanseniaspora valbyensis NRRL Y-1626]|uniref:Nucleotide-diphospho-sugar transferase n=1 Tax=Hanseniaspora valbyensis NRRL Y-1626 TaxID=766949 RepID=A0A1B7TAG1_9ASCO|nr:nucleotide-diphospho-sugar transferase [Hanseniaspora valbyensis NRRL Y-1626]
MITLSSLRRGLNYVKRSNSSSNTICLFLLFIALTSLLLINISSERDHYNNSQIEIIKVPQEAINNGDNVSPLNSVSDPNDSTGTPTVLQKTPDATISTMKETETAVPDSKEDEENREVAIQKFFGEIIRKIFTEYNPGVTDPCSYNFKEKDTASKLLDTSLGTYLEKSPSPGYWEESVDTEWPLLTYDSLQNNYLKVQGSVKEKIKERHTSFIESVLHTNDMKYPGTKKYKGNGIVFVAGGQYSVLAYSVIEMIRSRGTTLPIEVLIPENESDVDKKFCDMLSSELNGKCIYMDSIFGDDILSTYKFKGFQYKSLALMASSFENCLLLDADDYPLKNLDHIFKNEAFTQNGLILWPDFWRRTTHPFFYESANIKVNLERRVRNFIDAWSPMRSDIDDMNKIPYHDFEGTIPDPSSETGQLMISKRHHWKTLLLSLYYNVHGPNLFYHLLSQYAAGQGDKDTFIAAAHVLDLPYYQVLSVPSLDGYHEQGENGGYRGVAYYQKDFREDYLVQKKLREMMHNNEFKDSEDMEDYNPIHFRDKYFRADLSKSHALFAHCNLPKFNPVSLAVNQEYTYDNEHFRGLNSKECLGDLDMENEIIQSYYNVICGDKENIFEWMVNKDDPVVCDYLKKRLELFANNPL